VNAEMDFGVTMSVCVNKECMSQCECMDECMRLTLFSFFMLTFRITQNVCVNEDEYMRLILSADIQNQLFSLKSLNSCKFDINILP